MTKINFKKQLYFYKGKSYVNMMKMLEYSFCNQVQSHASQLHSLSTLHYLDLWRRHNNLENIGSK